MQKRNEKVYKLILLAVLCGILLLMAYTPLGYLNIGPLAITFNMIPVIIAAVALGPMEGAIAGGIFGLTSFLQCIGIGGLSPLGQTLFSIDPFLTFVMCFVPRVLSGLIASLIFSGCKKVLSKNVSAYITGLFSSVTHTVLFMTALLVFFQNTQYMQGLIGSENILLFACGFVGINAVVEILVATLVVGALYNALAHARLIRGD